MNCNQSRSIIAVRYLPGWRLGVCVIVAALSVSGPPWGWLGAAETAWPELVTGHPIVFVVRQQYAPDHHNTETMFQTGEINTASFRGGSAIRAADRPRARSGAGRARIADNAASRGRTTGAGPRAISRSRRKQ